MDNVDFSQVLSLITKGGPAAVVYAVLFGLAMLVREVRGGKLSTVRENDLNAKITVLEKQVATLTDSMLRMENELERALDLVHSMRYQRDQARIRVEFLEQIHGTDPRTTWPPEPTAPVMLPSGTPTVVLPPGTTPDTGEIR